MIRRKVMRFLFRWLFRFFYRIEITGAENIPATGSYIVVHNHVSVIDPPFLVSFWPVPPETVGSAHLWSLKLQSLVIRLYGTLPVRRGEFDRWILERMVQVVRAGTPLVIAPEGQRTHSPGLIEAFPGVAYLVDKGQAPVVPVGIIGSAASSASRAMRFKRPVLRMDIGMPFIVPPIKGRGKDRRAARKENADLIMKQLARMLPEDYRGVYAEQLAEPVA
jgi:1-acyl-sn-glycerol-3-phosphate acyltransferase